ncbi:unnamed protein product [Kuraishia capsulata CBS 1993]|uniref:Uncharacterized protein n=1 Tax=Kuraishia capsulata CBS 1993 TaxID=1382522 RepID=W6MMN3_9ASCO|nr:uncharacterized protein KUCA_T00003446001 [Kuraishia capsulata CBS 1993]CDK27468.1 unnamed protein product [Kuraishia capsulata CBS 1993]
MSQDAGFSNNPFLEDASQASVGRSDRLREPRAAKNRQRGLSLRTQLLNRSLMEQEIPSYSHKLSPTREFQTDDIELTAVDGSYASHDSQVFKFEPDYSDIDGPRTSDEEPSLLLGKRPKMLGTIFPTSTT